MQIIKMKKTYSQTDRAEALQIVATAGYDVATEKTGIPVTTLRSWKSRGSSATPEKLDNANDATLQREYVALQQENVMLQGAKEEAEILRERLKNALKAKENAVKDYLTSTNIAVSLYAKVDKLEDENETLQETYNDIFDRNVTLQHNIKGLEQELATFQQTTEPEENNTILIVAIAALHISAIYGVGEILSLIFGTWVMGYLTATVFVSAGLIMFVSKRFAVGISWIVLFATFILESYCNFLTMNLNVTPDKLAKISQHTNQWWLFLIISLFVPLVCLSLEYLLFNKKEKN
jgi:uncharacterized protein (UPF0335 family)